MDGTASHREVQLCDVSPRAAQAIFDELLRRASPAWRREHVWHVLRDEELPLADVPNAAFLAADGQVTLDVVLSGISQAGVALPAIEVSVWPGVLAIAPERGTAWTTDTVTAFLGLIADAAALKGGSVAIVLMDEHSELPPLDAPHVGT